MQHLKQSDIESHLRFAQWMKNNNKIVDDIWLSDEANFYLNGIVNKKKCVLLGVMRNQLCI